MEGPRPVRRDEMESLSRLVDAVFTDGESGAMFRYYQQFFSEENRANHLIYLDAGQVVSHVGMIPHEACLAGCTVRVGCIGSVATADSHRRQGLATRLFAAIREKAQEDGVDFLLISGNRSLYRRAGAVEVGCDSVAEVDAGTLERLRGLPLELTRTREADLAACASAYAARPAHFVRTAPEWRALLSSQSVMCREVRMVSVRRGGVFRAYLVATHVDNAGFCSVVEFAGDGPDLAAALPLLMDQVHAKILKLRLQQGDAALRARLVEIGADLQCVPSGGTLLLLRLPELMERLHPLFDQRIGTARAQALSFRTCEEGVVFADGAFECRVDIPHAASMLFGHPQAPVLSGVWADILPVPTLWYGMNYV